MSSFAETYGYPLWMPFAFAALCLTFVASIIAALGTGEWRLLLIALACWALVSSK